MAISSAPDDYIRIVNGTNAQGQRIRQHIDTRTNTVVREDNVDEEQAGLQRRANATYVFDPTAAKLKREADLAYAGGESDRFDRDNAYQAYVQANPAREVAMPTLQSTPVPGAGAGAVGGATQPTSRPTAYQNLAQNAPRGVQSLDQHRYVTSQTGGAPTAPTRQQINPNVTQRGAGQAGGPTTPAGLPLATVDYSRYDRAAREYDVASQTFLGELDRLSGVDPFGNQAFLQKATDRAVAQAAGTAAGARGGGAAQAGAQRQALGVQAQLAARGAQDMAQVRADDQNRAGALRLQAAQGLGENAKARAGNEVELFNTATQAASQNLDALVREYGIKAEIGQRERDAVRDMLVEFAKIDQAKYATDMDYRASVDQGMIQKYASDNALSGVLAQIRANGKLSEKEAALGVMGMFSGLMGGAATMSDRRAKFDVKDPDLRDLQDFLGKSRGYSYRYRDPKQPGAASGTFTGPMAQDLAKTKIGKALVQKGTDGYLRVDTARLALADHAALAALASEVEKLKAAKRG